MSAENEKPIEKSRTMKQLYLKI